MSGDENPIGQAGCRDKTPSLRSHNTGGMRFIDDQLGAVSFRECDQIDNRGAVAIHTENAFADDEFLRGAGKILA